ncbi:hypothetical protein GCM10011613_25890 [Cellvibrio zantedeschiae]|uniref:DUF5916 domain-containing protein n=1 Tax=Cellvibrio zantedeschiae TaxID=1237077 RepID=A0ABQ3B6S6_9GAMM|nr:carbohydrate binding family 9 domain-containing protein [Cellvibrio zantedeschiae]GGY79760.1 hypothetical protein GCM10011613_25890 [Cellvibrio zantedeschiae]
MAIKTFISTLLLLGNVAWAEAPTNYSHQEVQACDLRSAATKPVIDGLLDDSIWREHTPESDLHQLRPQEYGTPTERTEFWVCYDKDFLYLGVMAYMQDPSLIVARQHIQGLPMESDDQIHISIDPFNQKREGYFLQVNPNGIRNDALIWDAANGFNSDWDGIWFAAAKKLAKGWSAEMKIPFRTIGFDPATKRWGFNLGRFIRAKNELVVWNSLGGAVWEMGPVALGSMGDISDVSIGRGLEIQASAKQAYEYRAHGEDQSQTTLEPSLDVFYRPIPKVTLAATINTDFSATDVDDRIINLDRYDLYLPEKREFFLQDASRFAFGEIMDNGSPFFSRRIGLAGNSQPLDMHWGLKASGSLDNTSFGALAVNQDSLAAGVDTKTLFAARVAQNLSPQLTLGGVYTNGNPDTGASASTAGVDMAYNNLGQESWLPFRSSLWYQQTGPKQEGKEQAAYGAGLTLPGSRYELLWNLVNIEKDFDPGLGFVNRRDIRHNYAEGRYRYYFDSGVIQAYYPEFYASHVTNLDGEFQSQFVQINPLKFVSRWGDRIGVGRIFKREHLDSDFSPVKNLTIKAGNYEFASNALSIKTAEARRIFAELDLKQGDFYSGQSRQQKLSIGLRPWDRFLFQFTYGENDLKLDQQDVTTRLIAYKHEIAISNSWAWLTNIQYDNQSRRANFNYRLRWMPEPRMEMYLLYNRGAQKTELDNRFETEEETAALKFSYIFGL